MRIVINTIFLQGNKLESVSYFINRIFNCLAKQFPEHEFLFLVNKDNDNLSESASTIKRVSVSANPKRVFLHRYWNNIKLSMTLRSFRPDVFVQTYGCYNIFTSAAQLLVVHDVVLKKYPSFIGSFYSVGIFRQFLKKSKRIIALTESCKVDLVKQYKWNPLKIDVVPGAANDKYQPIPYALQQGIKEQYSAGTGYFLYTGDYKLKENLVNLLKAFSQFKKWQLSNMKLLIIKNGEDWSKEVLGKLKLYKHRSEIILLHEPLEEKLATVAASAYAILFPSFSGGSGVSAIESMQCGVPVIMEGIANLTEDRGGVLLYADTKKPESIAQQMLKLYKDETLRDRLIEEGKLLALQYNWNKSAAMFWQSILKVKGH
jgi:glycosyltransferase involved in cell wall biosynthesis